MNSNRIRRIGIGLLAAAAVAVPSAVAVASEPHYVTVKPAARPGSVNPKVKIHHGNPRPDKLGSASVTQCSGGPAAGTERLANYIEYWWPRGESAGIYNCRTVSGSSSYSLHAGGRAYDHRLSVHNDKDKAAGDSLVAAFLRADTKGNKYALAKRFGVQEIIWNCKIWTAERASEGLRPYGACPTSNDTIAHRDHVHIGQNLRGANRKTTAFTGWSWCEPRDGMCS
jgi:hypothetical protein